MGESVVGTRAVLHPQKAAERSGALLEGTPSGGFQSGAAVHVTSASRGATR
jgi:hypothetical protein